jgi:flagellar hook-associated protein 3 FlgL
MRVSSGMIFDAGVASMGRQTNSLMTIQQQVASGKRILSPSDDPVSAARAIEVSQATEMTEQFKRTQNYATSALSIEETQLAAAGDVLLRVSELAVQGGSPALNSTGRKGIAVELRARFDQLVGIANSTGGDGNFIFAGYKSSVAPFGGSVDNLLAGNEIVYQGDDGQRKLQVSPTRFVEISDSGSDVFTRIRNGNGYFTSGFSNSNTGTAVISRGAVTDPTAWNASATKDVAIKFTVTGGVTTYDLVDTGTGNSLLTGGVAPAPLANQRSYQPGQPIILKSQGAEPAFDLGGSVTVTGNAATGDQFTLAPSSSQSVFATIAKLIGALEAAQPDAAAAAQYRNDLEFATNDLNAAFENVNRVRAQVGSRMNEIDALGTMSDDMVLEYKKTLSNLQDIDYAEAITTLTRRQMELEAAQQSFMKIAKLSLFNFL